MMMGGFRGGAGGMGMQGMAAENMNFEKSQEDKIMVRSLDFTVDPDTIYRYRLRVVVWNPNYNREDVNGATVDTKADELYGPWSEPTNDVTMPADVTPYVYRRMPNGNAVTFQVLRWDPKDGVTVVRDFDTEPGAMVGDPRTAYIPVADDSGKRVNRLVDFTSRQFVLDAMGGIHPLPRIGINGSFEVPALSLLLRPDGAVSVRTEAHDVPDDLRQDVDRNYKKEVSEAGKRKGRQSSLGVNAGMLGFPGGGGFGGAGGTYVPSGGTGNAPPGYGQIPGSPGVRSEGPGLGAGVGR